MERRLAAITGASAGLGAEFARQIAAQGYDLLLIARREDRLRQICDQVAAVHDVNCEILTADLTNDADLLRVENRLRESPHLDLLINNAGFGTLGTFIKAPIESQDQMHRLHVLATMRLCHAALPGLVARDRGAIVNVSSVAAFLPSAGSVSYCATKAWVNRFTEGLFLELLLKRSRVTVQALCPGYTRTEFHQTLKMDTGKIPNWMWLKADRVVRDSLAALKTRKLFVIPGRRYRSGLKFYSLLPMKARHQIGLGSSAFRKPLVK